MSSSLAILSGFLTIDLASAREADTFCRRPSASAMSNSLPEEAYSRTKWRRSVNCWSIARAVATTFMMLSKAENVLPISRREDVPVPTNSGRSIKIAKKPIVIFVPILRFAKNKKSSWGSTSWSSRHRRRVPPGGQRRVYVRGEQPVGIIPLGRRGARRLAAYSGLNISDLQVLTRSC